MSTPLWSPSPETVERANLTRFTRFLESSRGLRFADYEELWRWSVTELADFWAAVWEFFDLDEVSGYDTVLAEETMPGARWFPGASLNFAGYLLERGEADAVFGSRMMVAGEA